MIIRRMGAIGARVVCEVVLYVALVGLRGSVSRVLRLARPFCWVLVYVVTASACYVTTVADRFCYADVDVVGVVALAAFL